MSRCTGGQREGNDRSLANKTGTYKIRDKPFKNIQKASDKTGIHRQGIAWVCHGKRNHAGGFVWKFDEDENNRRDDKCRLVRICFDSLLKDGYNKNDLITGEKRIPEISYNDEKYTPDIYIPSENKAFGIVSLSEYELNKERCDLIWLSASEKFDFGVYIYEEKNLKEYRHYFEKCILCFSE